MYFTIDYNQTHKKAAQLETLEANYLQQWSTAFLCILSNNQGIFNDNYMCISMKKPKLH